MIRYIANEMVCDNKGGLHTMRRPRVFRSEEAAQKYVMERVATEYTKDKGYNVEEVRGWENGVGAKITTVYYNGGFSEFYVHAEEV